MNFWDSVEALSAWNKRHRRHLNTMNAWRNAIGHQDFTKVGSSTVYLKVVHRQWRYACDRLAHAADEAVGKFLANLVGSHPWP